MTWWSGARHRPIQGHTDGPMTGHRGAVLHVNQSTGDLYGWVNSDHDMSCHFEFYRSGAVDQYLSTDDTSWAQEAGNAEWVSFETEGYTTYGLTAAQVQAIGSCYAWLVQTYGMALKMTDNPQQHGLILHSDGGSAWGGHPCPGPLRAGQRAQILAHAESILSAGVTLPAGADRLLTGHILAPGHALMSRSGRYVLRMQTDGNLVAVGPTGKVRWASNRIGARPGSYLANQGDGNVVVYDTKSHARWFTHHFTTRQTALVMQDDGNVVQYDNQGHVVWTLGIGEKS